jgi:hypothetical protein
MTAKPTATIARNTQECKPVQPGPERGLAGESERLKMLLSVIYAASLSWYAILFADKGYHSSIYQQNKL